uniref:Saposin B-type domain-containing protein n=1 Tax=Parascaris univalens TaxID=6257 RepID=A0A915AFM2_PARUN
SSAIIETAEKRLGKFNFCFQAESRIIRSRIGITHCLLLCQRREVSQFVCGNDTRCQVSRSWCSSGMLTIRILCRLAESRRRFALAVRRVQHRVQLHSRKNFGNSSAYCGRPP